jgi:ribosomal protein S27AE
MTERFERHRILEPEMFVKGSFRTHDIGKPGRSKRIAGKLKDTGKWATQSLLISNDEPEKMKKKLREQAEQLKRRSSDDKPKQYKHFDKNAKCPRCGDTGVYFDDDGYLWCDSCNYDEWKEIRGR